MSISIKWDEKDKLFIASCPLFPGIKATGESYGKAIMALKHTLYKMVGVQYGKQTK